MSAPSGQALRSHLFTVFGTDVPSALHTIYYLLSAHFQTLKEDTQSELFCSPLKLKVGLVHVSLFSEKSLKKSSLNLVRQNGVQSHNK